MVKHYNIYLLICPIDNVVRYVGKSKKPITRYKQHLKDTGTTTKKKIWISSLLKQGLKPILKIETTTKAEIDAEYLETKTIIKYCSTVYNIFMPGKNTGTVNDYKKINNIAENHNIECDSKIQKKYDKL